MLEQVRIYLSADIADWTVISALTVHIERFLELELYKLNGYIGPSVFQIYLNPNTNQEYEDTTQGFVVPFLLDEYLSSSPIERDRYIVSLTTAVLAKKCSPNSDGARKVGALAKDLIQNGFPREVCIWNGKVRTQGGMLECSLVRRFHWIIGDSYWISLTETSSGKVVVWKSLTTLPNFVYHGNQVKQVVGRDNQIVILGSGRREASILGQKLRFSSSEGSGLPVEISEIDKEAFKTALQWHRDTWVPKGIKAYKEGKYALAKGLLFPFRDVLSSFELEVFDFCVKRSATV